MARPTLDARARASIIKKLGELKPSADAHAFVIALESAAYFARHDGYKADHASTEKDRKRVLDKVGGAARKLSAALNDLDDDAQWYVYESSGLAPIVDRTNFLRLLARIQSAAQSELPELEVCKAQQSIAQSLREEFERQGLPFAAKETGFGAECMALAFELAGLSTENGLKYWIEKSRA